MQNSTGFIQLTIRWRPRTGVESANPSIPGIVCWSENLWEWRPGYKVKESKSAEFKQLSKPLLTYTKQESNALGFFLHNNMDPLQKPVQ